MLARTGEMAGFPRGSLLHRQFKDGAPKMDGVVVRKLDDSTVPVQPNPLPPASHRCHCRDTEAAVGALADVNHPASRDHSLVDTCRRVAPAPTTPAASRR